MRPWKFVGLVAALLLLLILMIGPLMLRRSAPLPSRATYGLRLPTDGLRSPAYDVRPRRYDLPRTTSDLRLLTSAPRSPTPRLRRALRAPVIETLARELDVLPGGGALQTDLADLPQTPRLDPLADLRPLSLSIEGFDLYRSPPPQLRVIPSLTRPDSLRPLYVSFATLQVLDAYSTWRVVKTGEARELNPLLTGVAGSLPRLLLVKGVASATSVYAVERLWKRNRTAAVVTMVGINAAYGIVVARNLKLGAADNPGVR